MVTDTGLEQDIAEVAGVGDAALRSQRPQDVERFDQQLRALESRCREEFQESIRGACEELAAKLAGGDPLEEDDLVAVELLFTGDVRYYLRNENSFDDWIQELQRLIGNLRHAAASAIASTDALMYVQALCRDALNVTPELLQYIREKERVELFRQNVRAGLSREQRRVLVRMIRDVLGSPSR